MRVLEVEKLKELFETRCYTLDETEIMTSCELHDNTVTAMRASEDLLFEYELDLENNRVISDTVVEIYDSVCGDYVKVTFYKLEAEIIPS